MQTHQRTGVGHMQPTQPEDKAGVYLLRAIARTTGARRSLIDFNDGTNGSRRTYADIRFVIRRAREFAQQDADGQAGGGLTTIVRMANR
jgi:hypothetical protein